MMKKLIAFTLIASTSLLPSFTANADEMSATTANVSTNRSSIQIEAFQHSQLCRKGGVKITSMGEYAIDIVSLYCLSDQDVDKLIKGLQDAKHKAAIYRSL